MKLRKGHTVELNIDKMAYGGRGIARQDGFVIFVGGVLCPVTEYWPGYLRKRGIMLRPLL